MEYNEMTRLVMSDLHETDPWSDDVLQDTEYALELDRRNVILEGVLQRYHELGEEFDSSECDLILKNLNDRYKKKGISEGVPKAVTNWIKEGIPANPAYRENLYKLCLALDMNLEEMKVFFYKYYMTIPFNFKNRIDAIYYYCTKMGKPYRNIKEMLEKTEVQTNENESSDDATMAVHMDIDAIKDDDIFIEYLKTHTYTKEKQFQTARAEIERIAELNADIAAEEIKTKESYSDDERIHHSIRGESGKVNYKELLRIIYGFDNQSRYQGEELDYQRLAKSEKLPERFRRSFPRDQEFSNIKNGNASPEVYRKALVLMKFYNFFGKSILSSEDLSDRSDEKRRDDFDEFMVETSRTLIRCGFGELYVRNPFDWIVLYCAHCGNPLDSFRELLDEGTSLDEE